MARGGYRVGAGRPKGAKRPKAKPVGPEVPVVRAADVAPDIAKAAKASKLSPLDYMLTVMNDDTADKERRDRMAIAAAPFCHARKSEPPGKKDLAAEAAEKVAKGEEVEGWGSDLNTTGPAH